MKNSLFRKKILILEGSLISTAELKEAFSKAGACAYVAGNLISAFSLIERVSFDGAVIDQGLHNEAFDFCHELRDLSIPYISCNSPHKLQGRAMRIAEASQVVRRLGRVISSEDDFDDDEAAAGVLSEFLRSKGVSGGGYMDPRA